jgi:hypothetical protein
MDLPALDLSLLVTLPKLIGPDMQRLREAIEHDDPDWGWDALTNLIKQIDTPQRRARLAAIVNLHHTRIGLDADKRPTRSWISTPRAPG